MKQCMNKVHKKLSQWFKPTSFSSQDINHSSWEYEWENKLVWYNSQTLWRKGKTSPCNSCITCKISGWKQINHAFRNTFLLLSLGGFRNYAKSCILKKLHFQKWKISSWHSTLREKYPNMEFFLVRILSYSEWIRWFTK